MSKFNFWTKIRKKGQNWRKDKIEERTKLKKGQNWKRTNWKKDKIEKKTKLKKGQIEKKIEKSDISWNEDLIEKMDNTRKKGKIEKKG